MRRRLAGLVLLASLTACATAERDRETVLLRDARECEADADSQLQNERAAEELLQELVAMVDHYRSRRVVVDLRNIEYLSSVAFRPLLNLRRKLQETDGRMILCNLSNMVGDIFYTTRLVSPSGSFDALFEMEPDLPAAITALTRNSSPS